MQSPGGDIYVFDIVSNAHTVYVASYHNQMWILDPGDMSMRELHFSYGGGGDHHVNTFADGRLYTAGHFRTFIQRYDAFGRDMTTSEVLAMPRENNPANFILALDPSSTANPEISSFATDLGATGIWAIHRASDRALWLGGDITRAGSTPTGGFVRLVDSDVPTNPVAPSSCSVTALGANGARVHWTRASNDHAANFVIRRSRDGGQFFWNRRVPVPATDWTTSGLPAGGTFTFSVETLSATGQRSAPAVCTGTVGGGANNDPVKVVSCWATPVDTSIRITWTRAADDNATRFVIERRRDGGPWYWASSVNAPATSWTNASVTNPGTYEYRVTTIAGALRSTPHDCGPNGGVTVGNGGGQVVTPASCTATTLTASSAQIDITRAAGDNASFFVIERSRNGGTWFWAGRVDAPTTTWNNTNIAAGASYRYRVLTVSPTGQRSSPRPCNGVVAV